MTFIHIKDNTSKLLKQNIKHNTKLGLHGFIGILKLDWKTQTVSVFLNTVAGLRWLLAC